MVIIGYIHGGRTDKPFEKALDALKRHDAGPNGRHWIGGEAEIQGLYVEDNRNHVCERFLGATYPDGTKPQWLMFLDTDVVFTAQQVYDLIDSAHPTERPIVGGLYFGYLDGKPEPVWRKIYNEGELKNQWGTLGKIELNTILPISAVGMGFTVIHRNVIEGMPAIPGDNWRWFGRDLWDGKHLGEDLTFCYRAAQAGYQTFGNSNIIVGHCKPTIITLETFELTHKQTQV